MTTGTTMPSDRATRLRVANALVAYTVWRALEDDPGEATALARAEVEAHFRATWAPLSAAERAHVVEYVEARMAFEARRAWS